MTGTPAADQQAGNVRVSDAERDAAVSQLSEHFQAGRLTTEEFDERAGLALAARTRSDLTSLMTDLPGSAQSLVTPAVSQTPAGQPGSQALSARRSLGWVWLLLAVTAVVSTVSSLVGHGTGVHVSLWFIPVGLLLYRRFCRGTRRVRQ